MIISPQNTTLAQFEFATARPDEVRHPAIVGGFGSGKTRAIPLRWLNLIDWRAKVQKKRCKLMVTEPTYELIRDVAVPTFDEFFDEHGVKHTYHKTEHNYTITYKGKKFTCMLRSTDNPSSLTGKTVTDIIIDEFDKEKSPANQRDIWNECNGRLRGCEYATLGCVTTPEGFRMTYELWVEKNKDNPQFRLIRAKTYDNQFLPADYIQGLYAQYDSQLVRQYIEGDFVNLTNMAAYYGFNRESHIGSVDYNKDLPIYVGMDFNVNPMTAVLAHVIDGKLFIFAEYYINNSNTQKTCELIASDYPDKQITVYPDMTGISHKTSAQYTDIEILRRFGFEVVGTYNMGERNRVNIVNNAFDKNRVVIDPRCKFLIRDLEQVVTNSYGQILKKSDDPLTHISDALGYLIIQAFKPERRFIAR